LEPAFNGGRSVTYRIPLLTLLILLAAVCSVQAQSSDASLDKISAYAGTWQIEIEHLDTTVSKAAKETTSLRNDCWRSGGFYACNQFVNGESKALLVFTVGDKDGDYVSHVIPTANGPVSGGALHIEGTTWTFPWDAEDHGQPLHFRVVNVFTGPDTIDYRQEFSRDGTEWTVAAKGTEHRVKD
jgi:hypothetical protein